MMDSTEIEAILRYGVFEAVRVEKVEPTVPPPLLSRHIQISSLELHRTFQQRGARHIGGERFPLGGPTVSFWFRELVPGLSLQLSLTRTAAPRPMV